MINSHISQLRREYTKNRLHRKDLPKEPFTLFANWLEQACQSQLSDPTAMTIATVDNKGQPYQRIVLLKDFNHNSMIFYTNLNSRKALQLANNSFISLHFSWLFLERQVMVLGEAERLSSLDISKYFYSRPRNSQISTWASHQSSYISSRLVIENAFLKMKKKFHEQIIPLPSFWGGYRINFNKIEFWQGRENRLHDRFIYERNVDAWQVYRLSP